MAYKTSTIILKVDLECRRCYKKISKAICQVQEKMNIQEIVFNEKTNTVTISGPFDPKKVCQKLCCKAYSVIKEIEIKEVKEKQKEAPKPDNKPKDDGKPDKLAEPTKDKPKDAKSAEPKNGKPKEAKPAESKTDKPKEGKPAQPAEEGKKDKPKDDKPKESKPAEQAEAKKDKPKEVKFAEPEAGKEKPKALEWFRSEPMYIDQPVQGYEPVWARPACGCQGYYGNNMCCGCAAGYGGGAAGYGWAQPGPSQVVYGKPVFDGYGGGSHNYFCEEDPQSCSIM